MANEAVQGLADSYSLLDRIPEAAREQFAVEEARIGYDVLAAQRRDVRKRTGKLEAGLSVQLQLDELRVRVGLIGVKAKTKRARGPNYGDLFYGRFVEFGRHAQTVLVTRRGKEYPMRVSALPASPYILVQRPDVMAEQRLATFWSDVLANAQRAGS